MLRGGPPINDRIVRAFFQILQNTMEASGCVIVAPWTDKPTAGAINHWTTLLIVLRVEDYWALGVLTPSVNSQPQTDEHQDLNVLLLNRYRIIFGDKIDPAPVVVEHYNYLSGILACAHGACAAVGQSLPLDVAEDAWRQTLLLLLDGSARQQSYSSIDLECARSITLSLERVIEEVKHLQKLLQQAIGDTVLQMESLAQLHSRLSSASPIAEILKLLIDKQPKPQRWNVAEYQEALRTTRDILERRRRMQTINKIRGAMVSWKLWLGSLPETEE